MRMKKAGIIIVLLTMLPMTLAISMASSSLTPINPYPNEALDARCMAVGDYQDSVRYEYQLFEGDRIVQRGTSNPFPVNSVATITKTTFDLTPGASYILSCRADNGLDQTEWVDSPPVTVRTPLQTVTVPVVASELANTKLQRYCSKNGGSLMADQNDGLRCVYNQTIVVPPENSVDSFTENLGSVGEVVWPSNPAGGWVVTIIIVAGAYYIVVREQEKNLARHVLKQKRHSNDEEMEL